MAAIHKDHQKNASDFMNAFWQELVKPYYEPEQGQDYWGGMLDKANDLADRYCKDDKRLYKIILGFAEGLEQEAKKGA